jgi:hypothetical protein
MLLVWKHGAILAKTNTHISRSLALALPPLTTSPLAHAHTHAPSCFSLQALEHFQGMGKKMGINPAKALQQAAKELVPYTGD